MRLWMVGWGWLMGAGGVDCSVRCAAIIRRLSLSHDFWGFSCDGLHQLWLLSYPDDYESTIVAYTRVVQNRSEY